MKRYFVNVVAGSMNPKNSFKHWLIKTWEKDLSRMSFVLVRRVEGWTGTVKGRPIAIGSFGKMKAEPRERVDLIHSQTNRSVGIAVVIGEYSFKGLIEALKNAGTSASVYSFD